MILLMCNRVGQDLETGSYHTGYRLTALLVLLSATPCLLACTGRGLNACLVHIVCNAALIRLWLMSQGPTEQSAAT